MRYVESPLRFAIPPVRQIPFFSIALRTSGGVLSIMDLIARTHRAGFELDTDYALHTGPMACDYSARFQSIIGTGTVAFVDGAAEKQAALRQIMLHNTGREDWAFSEAMLQAVCIFKLEVTSLSCKAHA